MSPSTTRRISAIATTLVVVMLSWFWINAKENAPGPLVSDAATQPAQEPLDLAPVKQEAANSRTPVPAQKQHVDEPKADAPRTFGAISGVVLLSDGQPLNTQEWEVWIEGEGVSWPLNRLKLKSNGSFISMKLQPGSFNLVAKHHSMSIARIENIEVVAGQKSKDARINPWLVDQNLREMRVRIAGQPGNSGATNVWALNSNHQIQGHAQWKGKERILYCSANDAPDVVIIAQGYLPLRLAWQDGVVDVELSPGLEVELQAVAPVALADGIHRGWFIIRPETPILNIPGMSFDVGFYCQDLIDGKPVRLRLPGAASYELRFDGDTSLGPGFIPMYRQVVQKGLLVTETDQVQRLLVSLPDPLKNAN